eukprot:1037108-Pyramimonas_sp.AAC.1
MNERVHCNGPKTPRRRTSLCEPARDANEPHHRARELHVRRGKPVERLQHKPNASDEPRADQHEQHPFGHQRRERVAKVEQGHDGLARLLQPRSPRSGIQQADVVQE